MIRTALTGQLGIDVPVIQAPMGGGPTTPRLVAAVSNAGGLGSVAGGYLSAEQLAAEIQPVRRLTDRPFAVNVFAPTDTRVPLQQIQHAHRVLEPFRRELGLHGPADHMAASPPSFDDHLDVLMDARPPVVSFTFGRLPPHAISSLHDAGCSLIGTATSVAEATALEEDGTDIVCAQGAEAGAHRGSFLTDPLQVLVPHRPPPGAGRHHGSHSARR